MKLSDLRLGRWNTGWTYRLRRYRQARRWNLPLQLVQQEYRSIKFTCPPHLTSLGFYKFCHRPSHKEEKRSWQDQPRHHVGEENNLIDPYVTTLKKSVITKPFGGSQAPPYRRRRRNCHGNIMSTLHVTNDPFIFSRMGEHMFTRDPKNETYHGGIISTSTTTSMTKRGRSSNPSINRSTTPLS